MPQSPPTPITSSRMTPSTASARKSPRGPAVRRAALAWACSPSTTPAAAIPMGSTSGRWAPSRRCPTETTPGDVAGLLQCSALQRGEQGSVQLQEVLRYYRRWVGGAAGSAVTPVAMDTVYADAGNLQSSSTTTSPYSWYVGTLQAQSV